MKNEEKPTPEAIKAARFISQYGNVTMDFEKLLTKAPTDQQLAAAFDKCCEAVDIAFAEIRKVYLPVVGLWKGII